MERIGPRLDRFKGRGPGFDCLRLLLASGVVLWHSFPLATGSTDMIDRSSAWLLVNAMVPMFFALSGFLVSGSAMRSTPADFLKNRVARIVPALAVVVLASAFLIGPLLTQMDLASYYTDWKTWRYVGNIVGLTAHTLPDVFADNPFPNAVNGSLWTVRYEILCYLLVAALMAMALMRNALAVILIFVATTGLSLLLLLSPSPGGTENIYTESLTSFVKVIGFFLAGSIAFHLRERLPFSHTMGAGCVLIVLAAGGLLDPAWRANPMLWVAMAPVLTYIVLWLGLSRLPRNRLFGGGDWSYGIYLWHFPILQLVMLLLAPADWFTLLLIAALPILCLAWLSWNLVEKPALAWRTKAMAIPAIRR